LPRQKRQIMKRIVDTSHFDTQGSIELTKNYNDASFELKKFLRFDGERFKITQSRQMSNTLWEFTVQSRDGTNDIYLASSSGSVRHIANA